MRLCSVIIGFLFLVQPAFALDLKEMQKIAVEKREVVKRYMIDYEKSERDIGRARAGYYPSVDVSYTVNSLDEDSTTEASENSVVYGAVTWNLFNGFRDKYQIESATLVKEVDGLQLKSLYQDIQLNVALRYLDVFERKANLEVAQNNYETLKKIYRDGKNRLEVGLIDKNELLKFKVDLDNSDILVAAGQAGLDKSVNLLGREIGENLSLDKLSFKEFDIIPAEEDYSKNKETMLAERSDLIVLDKLLLSSDALIKVEESEKYPKVNFTGSYTNYDDDFINGSGDVDEDELRAQLVLSLNLYRGGETGHSIAKAKLEKRGLQYDKKELTDTLVTELKNLHIDFDVSLRNVDVALTSIEQAEENLRITQLKYDEGLQRESDLLDAVTSLSRAQYNHVAVLRTVFSNYFSIIRMVENF